MAQKVRNVGADIGLALDGDGDRLIVCDEHGKIVDGDHIMAICAKELLKQRKLKKKTLVATVMSNMGLEIAMEQWVGAWSAPGSATAMWSNVCAQKGYSFGGEQSGHLVFLDHITTGDGILAGLAVAGHNEKAQKTAFGTGLCYGEFPAST